LNFAVFRGFEDAFEIAGLPDHEERIQRNEETFEDLLKIPVSRPHSDFLSEGRVVFKKCREAPAFG
jgi:hypothetical protein